MTGRLRAGDRTPRRRHTPLCLAPIELTFLLPKLVKAILAGTQPADMTAETLTRGERGLVWIE